MGSKRIVRGAATATALLLYLTAQTAAAQERSLHASALQQLNGSVAAMVGSVSRSVVQVVVTSYGPVDHSSRTDTDLVIGRQRSMGSGVVIDTGGYIMTNAHVVSNARRVQVILPGPQSAEGGVRTIVKGRGRTVDATIVGVAREIDLALLKVDEDALPALTLADYDAVRQGELVFAFGSPEGLKNSVTMGIVSAVARQADPDSPLVYVQTDAPINHGNSGGPLVNVNGELVGINTFIVSESGGSQGLGFAIPSALPIDGVPRLAFQLFTRSAGDVVRLKVLRGTEWYTADVTMTERPHDLDRLSDLVDPDKSLVEKLGVLAIDISSANESLASGLRVPAGVMVAGHTRSDTDSADAGLMTADTIHAVNGIPVASVDRLRAQLDALKPHAPVVLQIERNGQFVFLAFELD